MDEHENNSGPLAGIAERLAAAAEALDQAVARLAAHAEAQTAELGAKVDRIVAAVDEGAALRLHLEGRIAELERANSDLAARAGRKTLSPAMTALLAKSGVETSALDPATLDKALAGLSVEQRVAVKAEMARAGLIG
jgi:hypothetical protein